MAAADDEKEAKPWKTLSLQIKALVGSHTNSEVALETYEARLHDLWYACTQAAKVTPADDPAMDQLVLLVSAARERGPVYRILRPTERLQERSRDQHPKPSSSTPSSPPRPLLPAALALFTPIFSPPGKTILVTASSSSCVTVKSPTTTTGAVVLTQHHRNLASFTACLVDLGACRAADGRDRLALAALWLLRAAIEDSNDDDDGSGAGATEILARRAGVDGSEGLGMREGGRG
ncbi:hypothetical protein DIS24_g6395 [Lasiodiplodia hormozganensis]|uniref:Uncharacterized protein n=1 Tax=Lasiodiplodia hormozganensis TaxID=869390 RepID=A0AA40CUA7_9PEZI|nr:hypothetical protein DIS24_g6395 [Lasiodiplodia hormozganensis]